MVNSINSSNNSPSSSSSSNSSSSYTVKKGDTLSEIAQKQGVSLSSVIKANPQIKNPDLIFPGQQVNIPGRGASNSAASLDGIAVKKSGMPNESPAMRSQNSMMDKTSPNTSPGASNNAMAKTSPASTNASNMRAMGADSVAPPPNVSGGVTLQQLRQIMPTLSADKAAKYLPYLNSAMAEAKINTPERKAAFLAQLAHESGELKYFHELGSGREYNGRRDLGNIYPGDGERFKGRGPIQLTGRANYREVGKAIGVDLEHNPERAADVDVAFRTAANFWSSRNLNSLADKGNFDGITLRVNGGYNGKSSRDMYFQRASRVLGA